MWPSREPLGGAVPPDPTSFIGVPWAGPSPELARPSLPRPLPPPSTSRHGTDFSHGRDSAHGNYLRSAKAPLIGGGEVRGGLQGVPSEECHTVPFPTPTPTLPLPSARLRSDRTPPVKVRQEIRHTRTPFSTGKINTISQSLYVCR